MQALRRTFEAHNPLGHDQNKLRVYISEEKDVGVHYKELAKEHRDTARYMQQWGADMDPLITSMTSTVGRLYSDVAELHEQLGQQLEEGRRYLKAMRAREESLYEQRQRKKKLTDEVETLKRKGKPFDSTARELETVTASLAREDTELAEYRRTQLAQHFETKFNGLRVYAEKLLILQRAGSQVVATVPKSNEDAAHVSSGPWEAAAMHVVDAAVQAVAQVPERQLGSPSAPPAPSVDSIAPAGVSPGGSAVEPEVVPAVEPEYPVEADNRAEPVSEEAPPPPAR